ncbi:hypothetical protein pb186bvf_017159 [Paramecium bursaria]
MLQEFIQQNQQQIKKYEKYQLSEIKIIDKKEAIEVPFQPTYLHYVRYIDRVNNPSTDYDKQHLVEYFGELDCQNLHFGILQQPNPDQFQNQNDLHILSKFNENKFHSFEKSNEEFPLKQFYFRVWSVWKEFIYDNGIRQQQIAAYNQDGSLGLIPNKKIKLCLKINNETLPKDLENWNKFNQSFSLGDFELLKPGRWISSTAIDAYAYQLEIEQENKFRERLQNNTPSGLYTIIKSTFYVNIAGSGTDELIEHQYFPKFRFGLGLENIYSRIFIIINRNGTHWYLMELKFNDNQPLFYVYDSMQKNSQNYEKEVFDIWRVLSERGLVLKHYHQPQVQVIQTPQQRDGFSCGDHTVVKLRLAFEEKNFAQPLYDQNERYYEINYKLLMRLGKFSKQPQQQQQVIKQESPYKQQVIFYEVLKMKIPQRFFKIVITSKESDLAMIVKMDSIYTGQVDNNNMEGLGKIFVQQYDAHYNTSWFVFEGEFKKDQIQGKGVQYHGRTNKLKIEGIFSGLTVVEKFNELDENGEEVQKLKQSQFFDQEDRGSKGFRIKSNKPTQTQQVKSKNDKWQKFDVWLSKDDQASLLSEKALNWSLIEAYCNFLNIQDKEQYFGLLEEQQIVQYKRSLVIPFNFESEQQMIENFQDYAFLKGQFWVIYSKILLVINQNGHWLVIQMGFNPPQMKIYDPCSKKKPIFYFTTCKVTWNFFETLNKQYNHGLTFKQDQIQVMECPQQNVPQDAEFQKK